MTQAAQRVFKIKMSERCFRFKPDALYSHAPPKSGVYEFVTFDAAGKPTVLYVGLAVDGATVFDQLQKHISGKAQPTAEQLFALSKDIYFDYVADADILDIQELKDIAGALIAKHQPRLNVDPPPSSGRYGSVRVEEVE